MASRSFSRFLWAVGLPIMAATAWINPPVALTVVRSRNNSKRMARITPRSPEKASLIVLSSSNKEDQEKILLLDKNRRKLWAKTATQVLSVGLGAAALASLTSPTAWAARRSRTDGYKVQKSEREWKEQLSEIQYHILREGGTERPYYSILESEKRPGVFQCAGCGTPLFDASDKFRSGTGWPSFARALIMTDTTDGVEIEPVDPLKSILAGAELRCGTCGGHLGDVFQDGKLFLGTEAFQTGQRFCIDGAALVFYPEEGGGEPVRGDTTTTMATSTREKEPSWMSPPKIQEREREV